MSEYNKICEGYFTVSSSHTKILSLPAVPDTFEMWNKTKWGEAPAGAATPQYAIGFQEDAVGTYRATSAVGSSSSAALQNITGTSGGFSFVSAGTYQYGPTLTITGIVASTGVVTTSTNHNLIIGDTVLLYATTGMLQIAGTTTTVTAVPSATTFTIGNIPTSGFSNATAGFAKKLIYADLYVPFNNIITGVTVSTNTTSISTSLNHSFVVGQEVFFRIPQTQYVNSTPVWGITGLDSQAVVNATGIPQQAYITSITNANTFVINKGSANGVGGTFTYPTSAQAAMGITFPQVMAIGDQNFGFSGLPVPLPVQPTADTYTNTVYPQAITIPGAYLPNTGNFVIIGSTLIPNTSDVIRWRAIFPDQVQTS